MTPLSIANTKIPKTIKNNDSLLKISLVKVRGIKVKYFLTELIQSNIKSVITRPPRTVIKTRAFSEPIIKATTKEVTVQIINNEKEIELYKLIKKQGALSLLN